MKPIHIILVAVVAVVALLAVTFRYEVIPNGRGGFLKTDRLTGESTFVVGDKEREVRKPNSELYPTLDLTYDPNWKPADNQKK